MAARRLDCGIDVLGSTMTAYKAYADSQMVLRQMGLIKDGDFRFGLPSAQLPEWENLKEEVKEEWCEGVNRFLNAFEAVEEITFKQLARLLQVSLGSYLNWGSLDPELWENDVRRLPFEAAARHLAWLTETDTADDLRRMEAKWEPWTKDAAARQVDPTLGGTLTRETVYAEK